MAWLKCLWLGHDWEKHGDHDEPMACWFWTCRRCGKTR